jgi:hypothetical protein
MVGPAHPSCQSCTAIADAIERVAREFAEKALRQVVSAYQHPNMPTFIATACIPQRKGLYGLGYSTLDQAKEHVDWAVAAAIDAAGKE